MGTECSERSRRLSGLGCVKYGLICELVPEMNQVSRCFDKICLRYFRYARAENIALARIYIVTNGNNFSNTVIVHEILFDLNNR